MTNGSDKNGWNRCAIANSKLRKTMNHPPNARPPNGKRGPLKPALSETQNQSAEDSALPAPTQGREVLFHSLATQHVQRVAIIALLTEISRKLDVLISERIRS